MPVQTTEPLTTLRGRARTSDQIWQRLVELCEDFGPRPAASSAMSRAVDWAEKTFRVHGHDVVQREEVVVPNWVRGKESLTMTAPVERQLSMLGLGGSIGTTGLKGSVVAVRSFDELGPHVEGKIVLYNPPPPSSYGTALPYRIHGASRAAAHGAAAALVRSFGTGDSSLPHTGVLGYDPETPKIPAAAISSADADFIQARRDAGSRVQVRLRMAAETLPEATSHNVLAEITGSLHPEEIVVVGAHLDSWDVGAGAEDDGVGVVHTIEALRLIKDLGLRPRRTIRGVLWTGEETGAFGGKAYARAHAHEPHLAGIESDHGAGRPRAWGVSGSAHQVERFREVAEPVGLPIQNGGSAVDLGPLIQQGVLGIGLVNEDQRLFDVHHTVADTLDRIDPNNLRDGLAAVAGLAWELANTDSLTPTVRAGEGEANTASSSGVAVASCCG